MTSTNSISYDDIFEKLTDFELSNILCGAIEDEYGYEHIMEWPDTIPIEYRVIHYVWSITGFLEGQGFIRLMPLKCNHNAYAKCFDVLDIPDVSKCIRDALELTPLGILGDYNEAFKFFDNNESYEDSLEPFQNILYSQSEHIQKMHCKYIRHNKSKFKSLYSSITVQSEYKALLESKPPHKSVE